jgi:hypothetical protein
VVTDSCAPGPDMLALAERQAAEGALPDAAIRNGRRVIDTCTESKSDPLLRAFPHAGRAHELRLGTCENGGGKLVHGSGGLVLLRAA